ncbi:hypothetical protein ONZ45_g11078 [Pleurotus djamor]|nr:hypothetical protein ONZ45_g11078 [Pleurotus djamor]
MTLLRRFLASLLLYPIRDMASKTITAATTHYLQFDIQWSSLALLYYDYTLTFPMEVKYIWGQSFRLSTILYIFCRYALLANVLYLLAIANKLQHGLRSLFPSQSCTASYRIISALSILGRSAVIITFTKRAYAIFSRNKYVLVYLSLIGATAIGLDIVSLLAPTVVRALLHLITNSGARSGRSLRGLFEKSDRFVPDLLLSILMVVFEASSAILTIARCIQAFRVGGVSRHRGSLMHMIFEQGVLYFSIISLFTTAAVILNVKAPAGFFQRLLNAYTLPLSCLLTARFLLHLRAYDEKTKTVLSNPLKAPQNGGTLGTFRAAARGVYSTVIEPFGDDPVHAARSQSNPISGGNTDTIGGSVDNVAQGDIVTAQRKRNIETSV